LEQPKKKETKEQKEANMKKKFHQILREEAEKEGLTKKNLEPAIEETKEATT